MLILLWLWKMCFARAVLPMSPPSGMAVRVCRGIKTDDYTGGTEPGDREARHK